MMILCLSSITAQASSPEIAVAVVNGQFTAELGSAGEILVTIPETGEKINLQSGKYFLNAEGGTINLGPKKFGVTKIKFAVPENGKPLEVNKKTYRGGFEVSIANDGKTMNVVNVLPLEEYVYSVIGEEIPVIFPDEAIKAQAVAIRTFAYNKLGTKQYQGYDLKATEEEQNYYGLATEKAELNKFVDATNGMVVTYNGYAIEAVYHTSGGGKTESSRDVWGKYVPYLRSVEDYDQDAPMYSWEKAVPAQEIERRLSARGYNIGKLESMRLSPLDGGSKLFGNDRTSSGRVANMMFSGTGGVFVLTGLEVQELMGINSSFFEVHVNRPVPNSIEIPLENSYGMKIGSKEVPINVGKKTISFKDILKDLHFVSGEKGEMVTFKGSGEGNGLGLSKWGARGMANNASARDKEYYKEILTHYYVDTRVEKFY